MSKFQSTVSTVAALASIFGAAAAGWKLAEVNSNHSPSELDKKIEIIEKKLEEASDPKPVEEVAQPQPQVAPQPPILTPVTQPSPPPPVPPVNNETSYDSPQDQQGTESPV